MWQCLKSLKNNLKSFLGMTGTRCEAKILWMVLWVSLRVANTMPCTTWPCPALISEKPKMSHDFFSIVRNEIWVIKVLGLEGGCRL